MARGADVRRTASIEAAGPEGELDLGAIGRALWRKKWWVLVPAMLVAVLAFAAVNVVTPRYRSEARLILEGRDNVFLRPEAEKGAERERLPVDAEAVTSQVQLALSREVARDVIKRLKLAELPEFDPVLRGVGTLKHILIMLGVTRDPLRMSPEERVFETYYERVQAYQVDKSRVIAIEFRSADPRLAARGANAVAEAYLAIQQSIKQDQTREAGRYLADRIEELRAKVAEAESNVEQFRSRHNLFMGTNNTTLSNQTLGEINAQLGTARAQAADADSKARAIRDMLRSGRAIEAGEIINSELIRRLNEQRVTLRAQLAEQSSTLLGGHPRIKELRAQISDLERQIREEAERLVRALDNDAQIAAARVKELTVRLEQLMRLAAGNNEQDVQLRALEREAKAQRDLLESYLAKYRETVARENLGSNPADARIISPAIVSNTPYFPKKLPIVLVATLATLLLGMGFISTGELLAGTVYRPAGALRAPDGGFDPPGRTERSPGPFAQHALEPAASSPLGSAADAAPRGPGTTASLAGLAASLQARPEGRSRIALVGHDEADDTAPVALALGRLMAHGARTVVVDLVMAPAEVERAIGRRPIGLADLVRDQASFGEIITRDAASPAHLVAAGNADGEGAAVIASERLAIALAALERTYAHVVLSVGSADAVSPERLALLAPCIVVVASARRQEAAATAAELLAASGCREVVCLRPEADGDAGALPREVAVAA
jgi:polysaccharide biosynthesis transport protein